MNMDIEYIQNEGLLTDLKFLFKTVSKVFKSGEGAV